MCIAKNYDIDPKICHVRFKIQPDFTVQRIALVGDFNDWDEEADLFHRQADGSYTCEVQLTRNRNYKFRYLLNDSRWLPEKQADLHELSSPGNIVNNILSV